MAKPRREAFSITLGRFLGGICIGLGISGDAGSADVVVVCPDPFRPALQPWIEHRQSEGLSIDVVSPATTAEDTCRQVARVAASGARYVVLVGDAPAIGAACRPESQVATGYFPAKVTRAWGSTPTIASDFGYADLDGDGAPDAAVGRLPVDSAEQLQALVSRILSYETSGDFGLWRGQVQLTGGVGGFGLLADTAIETVTRTLVTSVLPAETKTTIAYASPGHRFFPREVDFRETVLDRYRAGARFWVYAGHGWIDQLDRVPSSAAGVPVLDGESVRRLQRHASAAPIALMLACYTGAVDAPEDSLAEKMLLAPGGPIAVFAGSRVTMPYGNATAAVGLIDGVYRQRLPRLGDAWLETLIQMNRQDDSADKSAARLVIDTLGAFGSLPGTTLADERREHMQLYQLFGDPTLRLHHPEPLQLALAEPPTNGKPIRLNLTSPIGGDLLLSIDRPLGSPIDGDPNETTVASLKVRVLPDQAVEPVIELPRPVQGPIIVRALVTGAKSWATAAATAVMRE